MQNSSRPKELQPSSKAPDSASELKAKHGILEEEGSDVDDDELGSPREGNNVREKSDDFDEWLGDSQEADIKQQKRPMRGPGLGAGTFSLGAPTAKAKGKAKAKATAAAKEAAAPTTDQHTAASAANLQLKTEQDPEVASHSKKSKTTDSQLKDLDSEMQLVAQKHLATKQGTSVKALEGLTVRHFLEEKPAGGKGYANSAKLRGVPWLHSMPDSHC